MTFQSAFDTLFQTALFITLSPAVPGLLRWIEARMQGRRGPSILQPYYDIRKLFSRQVMIPETTSWIYAAAPLVVFDCYVLVGLLTPVAYLPTISQPLANSVSGPPFADLLVIIYLLGLARFVMGLAGMDSGSPFTGMGSGREMFLHVLAEPVLVVAAYVLALDSNTTSLSGVMMRQAPSNLVFFDNPPFLLVLLSLALIMLLEAGRIPFDDPESNLELGMIGKAVHLEYGGPHLALLQWAEAMRLTFFITLLVNLAFPALLGQLGVSGLWSRLGLTMLYPLKLFFMVACLAFWEMSHAKLRLRMVPGPAELALVYGVLAVFAVVVTRYFFYSY